MSLTDTAVQYALRFGWSVHPVNTAKKPITPHGRNDATRSEPAIRKMFKNGSQIGVATGTESGLFVLDIDLDEAKGINGYETLLYLESVHGPLPKTPQQRTGRGGMQYLFRHFDGAKNSSSKIGAGVDTRGAGGYIVVAPSHNQAGPYQWIVSPDDCPLAECPAWIIEALREAETPQQPQSSANGNERSYCQKMLGQAVARVATAADGQKHEMLLKMARWLGGFVPTLSEIEIESALFAAIELRADDHRNARKTIQDGIAYGKQQPLDPPKQRQQVEQRVNTTTGEIVDPRPVKPQIELVVDWRQQGINAADLQRKIFDALMWIIDGILPEGATLLAGKPKSKKSWLALAAAVAVAMAGKVLGYYDVHQGEVLYLDLESNQRRMKSRLNSLIGSVVWPANLHIFTEWPRGQDGIMALDQWILAYPATKLIVIDILQNFRPRRNPKADPYDQDYEAVKMINEFAERHRIAVLIIHHTRKAKADDVFDEISGTTGLSGGVASMWVLGRSPDNSGESILAIRGRDISDDDPMAIKWDNYSCQFVRVASGQEVSSGAARRQVLDAMDESSEYPLKEIAAAVQKSVSATSNLIRRLMDDGLIQRTGNGRYARIPQKPSYLSESRESRESDVKRESDVSLESDHSQETFTLHEDVKVDVKVVQPLSEQTNDNFHDFHADLYRDAQSNIITLDITNIPFSDLPTEDLTGTVRKGTAADVVISLATSGEWEGDWVVAIRHTGRIAGGFATKDKAVKHAKLLQREYEKSGADNATDSST